MITNNCQRVPAYYLHPISVWFESDVTLSSEGQLETRKRDNDFGTSETKRYTREPVNYTGQVLVFCYAAEARVYNLTFHQGMLVSVVDLTLNMAREFISGLHGVTMVVDK